jgi:hypothetical protein
MAINIARWKFVAALSGTAIAWPLSPPMRNARDAATMFSPDAACFKV